jgi:hypothetical protein
MNDLHQREEEKEFIDGAICREKRRKPRLTFVEWEEIDF